MSKQLLIYQTAVPLSPARHAGRWVEVGHSFAFSAGVNAVPLMAVEILRAAGEYAVVFTGSGEEVMPVVVLGLRGDQNLYLGADGHWMARYVPAFLRRYPFVFAASGDGSRLTLCIDESHPGLNMDGRGEQLFGRDGAPTPYVERVLGFMNDYQAQFARTQAFARQVQAMGLLEPMQAQVSTPDGGPLSLSGFMVVSRERLRELAPDQLKTLAQTDALELLYLHLHSLRNFRMLRDRLLDRTTASSRAAA
jgi:hypothetical protein